MDDDDDRSILEFILVAGFVTGVVVITLCLSIYYVCCYRSKANRRKTNKSQRQRQRLPSVAIVSVESHRTADLHQTENAQTSSTGDVATQEFPTVVSMEIMEHDVRYAPPPYYATERDLPPPYSIIDAPAKIITEVN